MRYSVQKIAGRAKIVFGSGANSTQKAVEASKKAEAMGADGLLVVTPYYNKCTQGGLYEHYKAVAESVKIPVICYNVPARTGVNILPATMNASRRSRTSRASKRRAATWNRSARRRGASAASATCIRGTTTSTCPSLPSAGRGSFRSRRTSSRAKQNRCTNTLRRATSPRRTNCGQDAARHRPAFHRGQPHPRQGSGEPHRLDGGVPRLPLTRLEPEHARTLKEALAAFDKALLH